VVHLKDCWPQQLNFMPKSPDKRAQYESSMMMSPQGLKTHCHVWHPPRQCCNATINAQSCKKAMVKNERGDARCWPRQSLVGVASSTTKTQRRTMQQEQQQQNTKEGEEERLMIITKKVVVSSSSATYHNKNPSFFLNINLKQPTTRKDRFVVKLQLRRQSCRRQLRPERSSTWRGTRAVRFCCLLCFASCCLALLLHVRVRLPLCSFLAAAAAVGRLPRPESLRTNNNNVNHARTLTTK